jgi:hypothetical protein
LLGPDGPGEKIGMRLFRLLGRFIDFPEFAPTSNFGMMIKQINLYKDLSERTFQRDLAVLMIMKLIKVDGLNVRPNLDVMDDFAAANRPLGDVTKRTLSSS